MEAGWADVMKRRSRDEQRRGTLYLLGNELIDKRLCPSCLDDRPQLEIFLRSARTWNPYNHSQSEQSENTTSQRTISWSAITRSCSTNRGPREEREREREGERAISLSRPLSSCVVMRMSTRMRDRARERERAQASNVSSSPSASANHHSRSSSSSSFPFAVANAFSPEEWPVSLSPSKD